ncbi:MAG: hydrogenase maturation protease [Synergistales bacterium]|nr:hydrogenase maturation protease [Synergistales bacterium]MDI9391378.1 hydrogenase maturation protease [Synergistota bacterium]
MENGLPSFEVHLWGLGNRLRGDDGVGVYIAESLIPIAPPRMRVVVCETVPENYTPWLLRDRPKELVVVDAANMGLKAGSVRRLALDELAEAVFETHGITLPLILEPHLEWLAVTAIGIQPEQLSLSLDLSPAVHRAASAVISIILNGTWQKIPHLHQRKRSPK